MHFKTNKTGNLINIWCSFYPPTGFKSILAISAFIPAVISLMYWSLREWYGMNCTGMEYGFFFVRSSETRMARRCVAAGWRFLTNKFRSYFKWSDMMFLRQTVPSSTRALPGCRWGRRSSIKPLKAWACWRSVLYSTLSQHRAFINCWDVFGLLNFFWEFESASFRPSAKNDWSC